MGCMEITSATTWNVRQDNPVKLESHHTSIQGPIGLGRLLPNYQLDNRLWDLVARATKWKSAR
jgi:hypothetical protein